MKVSLIFRLQRWFYFLLKGVGKKEHEHHLFVLPEPLDAFAIYGRMADKGWQPNYIGYSYRGQIYQCRKLMDYGRHQYHVRFYDDGLVTGHCEITPEWSAKEHLGGVDLRIMDKYESQNLRNDILIGGFSEKI